MKILTQRDNRFYELAMMLAETSECHYRMSAVITNGARVLSLGVNQIKTHPKQAIYREHVVSIHAELAAILHARTDLTGATIYIARWKNLISKPCLTCREIIREAGITTAVYHNGSAIEKVKL